MEYLPGNVNNVSCVYDDDDEDFLLPKSKRAKFDFVDNIGKSASVSCVEEVSNPSNGGSVERLETFITLDEVSRAIDNFQQETGTIKAENKQKILS